MTEKEDDIGKLFRTTLDGLETPIESGEWESMQTHLQKWNFFHFNAFQFNIYYAGMVIFCFITCAFVGTHYTYTNFFKKTDLVVREEQVVRDKVKGEMGNNPLKEDSKNEKSVVGERNNQIVTLPRKYIKLIENKIITRKEESKLTALDTNRIETPIPAVVPVVSKPDSVKPKPKRVVYLTKQDTIIQFDTIQAPKKKKKWFK